MATKRPSKDKRAAHNRSQRAARAARTENANAPATTTPSSPSGAGSLGGGGLFGRRRGAGAGGGGGQASARARGAALRPDVPPGFRAALSAVFAAAAALILCVFVLRYPVDARDELYISETLVADWSVSVMRALAELPEADPATVAESVEDWTPGSGNATVMVALWPYSLASVLPLFGAGLGFLAVRKRSPSKVVNRALYATLFAAVLTQGLLLLFLPVVLAMGVAMFQVRKAEMVARASGVDDGVIDADAVDLDLDAEAERDDDVDPPTGSPKA